MLYWNYLYAFLFLRNGINYAINLMNNVNQSLVKSCRAISNISDDDSLEAKYI